MMLVVHVRTPPRANSLLELVLLFVLVFCAGLLPLGGCSSLGPLVHVDSALHWCASVAGRGARTMCSWNAKGLAAPTAVVKRARMCSHGALRIMGWSWLRMHTASRETAEGAALGGPNWWAAALIARQATRAHSTIHHARILHVTAVAGHGACDGRQSWQKHLSNRSDRLRSMAPTSSASSSQTYRCPLTAPLQTCASHV